MPQHRVQCHRQIPRKAAEVWQVLAGFDLGWHPGIAQCAVFRGPSGALLRRFKDVSGQVYELHKSQRPGTGLRIAGWYRRAAALLRRSLC